jgi:hypothetical protein
MGSTAEKPSLSSTRGFTFRIEGQDGCFEVCGEWVIRHHVDGANKPPQQHSIIDDDTILDLSYLIDASEAQYEESLKLLRDAAQAISENQASWWDDIQSIMIAYSRIKTDSDTLLESSSEMYPSLERYRLPDIDTKDAAAVIEAMKKALENALKRIS